MSYSPEESNSSVGGFKLDAFIPIVLLSLSLIVLFAWQITLSNTQRDQLNGMITRQVPEVAKSQKVQDGVSKLVQDLLTAAQTDPTAKAIVDKYQIKSTAPAGGAADASASASASPGL